MSVILAQVQMALLSLWRRPGYLVALLLCPLVLALGLLLPREARGTEILVGISLPEDSPAAAELWERLEEERAGAVTYRRAAPEEVRAQVAAGHWECGFLLAEDFEDRLAGGRYEDLVTQVVSPASTMALPLREPVSAALLELCWQDIAGDCLARIGLDLPPVGALEDIIPPENRVAVRAETVGTDAAPREMTESLPYADLLTGGVGLWLQTTALLAAGHLRRWLRGDWARLALPRVGLGVLLLPRAAVLGLAAWLAGAAALLLTGGDGRALACLALYQLCLTAASAALALLPGAERLIAVLLPVTPLACVICCPVLLDAAMLVPALYPVSRALPLTHFLLAVQGQMGSAAMLAGMTALWGAAAWALGRRFARSAA